MNLLGSLFTALNGLRVHLIRAILSMLGIVCGVASVVAVVAVSNGASKQSMQQLSLLGARNIIVRGNDLKPDDIEAIQRKKKNRRISPGLNMETARRIAESTGMITRIAPVYYLHDLNIKFGDASGAFQVVGTTPELLPVKNLSVATGRFLMQADVKNAFRVCVVEDDVRRELFPTLNDKQLADGAFLVIDNDLYRVIGILKPKHTTQKKYEGIDMASINRNIYIPLTTAHRRLTRNPLSDPVHEIIFEVDNADDITEASRIIETQLGNVNHMAGIDPEQRDFKVTIPRDLIELQRKSQRLFEKVMGLSAGISLIIGGIGIMNIMLANVNERRREIGIRRAVGARQSDILRQFLTESLLICLIGGVTGSLVGIAATISISRWTGWETSISVSAMLIAITVSLIDGVAFGTYPAWKAGKLDPIEALNYE